MQRLKLATSNLVYNLGLGSSLPRNNFYDQNWRGPGQGVSKKFETPYLFLQPLKLTTSSLVYDLGLGSSLLRNNFYDQNWRSSGLGEYPKKCGTRYLFLQPLKLATEKLVHNMSSGLPCQTKFQGQTRQGLNQESTTPLPIMMTMQLYVPSKTDGYLDQSTKWNQTENLSERRQETDQHDQVRLRHMIREGNPRRQFCCNNSEM